jgi:hypothetical protein
MEPKEIIRELTDRYGFTLAEALAEMRRSAVASPAPSQPAAQAPAAQAALVVSRPARPVHDRDGWDIEQQSNLIDAIASLPTPEGSRLDVRIMRDKNMQKLKDMFGRTEGAIRHQTGWQALRLGPELRGKFMVPRSSKNNRSDH